MVAAKRPEPITHNPHLGNVDDFVRENAALVYKVASQISNIKGYDFEDICSEGMLGLLHAYQRFDPTKTGKFSTYAVTCIRGFILRYLNTKFRMIRIPVHLIGAIEFPRVVSSDIKIMDDEHGKSTLLDLFSTEDDQSQMVVSEFVTHLSKRKQGIVKLLLSGYSQTDVSKMLKISRQRVSKILSDISLQYEREHRT